MKLSVKEMETLLEQAGTITEGGTARINHSGCATTSVSRSMSITRDHHGYLFHCFKCDRSGYLRAVDRSEHTKEAYRSAGHHHSSIRGDSDARHARCWTSEISRWGTTQRAWITRYLTPEEVRRHGIECDISDRLGSVRFPVSPHGYVTRTFRPGYPKYLSPKSRAAMGYYRSVDGNPCSLLVCTEDIISAVVLSRYTDAVSCCGTTAHEGVLRAAAQYDRALVFFDDDNQQVKLKALQAQRKLQLVVRVVYVYHSNGKDPKDHTDEELQEILRRYHGV